MSCLPLLAWARLRLLLSPFIRACLGTLTFRALGRDHIMSTPFEVITCMAFQFGGREVEVVDLAVLDVARALVVDDGQGQGRVSLRGHPDIEGQVRVGELVLLVLVRARGGLSGVVSGRGQVAVAGLRLHDVGQFPPLARAWTRLCCLTEFHHFDIQSTGRAHIGLRAGLLNTDTRLIEFHHFDIQSTGQKSHLPLSHSFSGGSRGKGVGEPKPDLPVG